MKSQPLSAMAWIAIGYAAVLMLAIASVHHFQITATSFMSAGWWWMDLAGLSVATSVWLIRTLRQPTPKADEAELLRQGTASSEHIGRELNHA